MTINNILMKKKNIMQSFLRRLNDKNKIRLESAKIRS